MAMALLYRNAATVLKKLEGKKGSLKSLVFSSKCALSKKKLFVLTSQTLKYKELIMRVIEESTIEKEPKLGHHLCLVLVYDVLFGKGIQCGGLLKAIMTRHKDSLKAALAKHGDMKCAHTRQGILPKYARVNLLKISTEGAVSSLSAEGYALVSREIFLEHLKSCSLIGKTKECHNLFCRDDLLDYLFMFCPSSSVTSISLYATGQLILQDKASCLPAHLLSPIPGSCILDACAAPGNKTTQVASLISNTGTVYAFDKDKERFNTLTQFVQKSGATCVRTIHQDFLTVTPSDLPDVKYILIDPSCSGSGIVNRVDYGLQNSDRLRLKSLSLFQKRILKHALSFPNVERVVYSTCSVHCQENEEVVQHALSLFNTEFDLVNVLPEWKRRGKPLFSKGSYCIRANSDDLTNGFFVAVFERTKFKPVASAVPEPEVVKTGRCKTSRMRRRGCKLTPVTNK